MIRTGNAVIYRTGAAVVTGVSDGKFSILLPHGDTKNVREKDISFVLHPGPAQHVPQSMPPPDGWQETLELIEDEDLSFKDFTEFIFGSYMPETAFGAWSLIQEGIYFTLVDDHVHLRPRADIESALAAIQEKQAAKEKHAALVQRIRDGCITEEDRPFLSEIEQVASGIISSSRLMKEIGLEALPEKAHKLLLRLGIWDLTHNPFPSRAGVSMEDPVFPLSGGDPLEERTDLTGLKSYAIDDISSNDPDDAISWEDGLLYVHTADPASGIAFGSEADLEARERGENLYLPEKVIHMLPLQATEIYGLGLQETSPALTFVIRFQESGRPELVKIQLSRVAVQRMTYETAAPLLEDPAWSPLLEHLEKFRRFREEHGALFIRLPEVKIVAGDEIRFIPTPVTPEREFVANCMLAAGAAVASWADQEGITLPFVRQEEPENPPAPGDSMPEMYALRRSCRPGTTDTIPGLHAGLGLEPYTRVTSPLRRYADLLAHMQLRRYIKGEELIDADDMASALHASEAAALIRRKLERKVNEYWTLIHFFRHSSDLQTEAQVVFKQDDRCFFLLPDFAYEYRTRFRGQTGAWYQAVILSCDPATFSLRLKLIPLAGGEAEESESETPEEPDTNIKE